MTTTHPAAGFRAVFRREWALLNGSLWLQSLHFFGPVAVLLILWALFARQVLQELPIVVVDADQSSASRQLIRMIDAGPGVQVVEELAQLGEAESRVRRFEAYAIVFIPEHFSRDLAARRGTTVTCFYNAQITAAGGTVNRDVGAAVRTFGGQIEAGRAMAGGAPQRSLAVRLQPIAAQGTALFNPEQSYAVFLFTAFAPAVLQLLVLLGTIWAVGTELRQATAGEWLERAGGSILAAVAGKLSLYFLLYALVGLAALAGLHGWLGWEINGSSALLAVGLLAFIAASQAIGVLVIGVLANLRSALSIGSLYAAPAFGFSGVPLPDYALSGAALIVHRLLPLSTYLKLYTGQTFRGVGFTGWLPDFGVLCLFVAAGFGLGLPRLRQACLDPKKWGAQ